MAAAFRLFTESESAKFAGVSVDTIRQYERFGLLASVKKDNELFYRENDLRALFGVREPLPFSVLGEKSSEHAPPSDSTSASSSFAGAARTAAPQSFATTNSSMGSGAPQPEQVRPQSSPGASAVYSAPYQQPTYSLPPPYSTDGGQHSQHGAIQAMSITQPGSPGVYELLEANRSLREQIQMLKDEREWLRQRVEKFESRTERDQMLLISENDTVKTLIHQIPEKRRSFWSFALPWLKSS